MLTFLITSLPIFAVIGLGAITARRGVLPEDAVKILNWFAFNIAVPALMVRVVARQNPDSLLNLPFLFGALAVSLVLFALALAASLVWEGRGLATAASRGQGATIGNLGFLGIPLLLAFLGERVAAPIAIVSIVDLVIIIPLALGLMQAARGGGSALDRAGGLVRGALLNPFIASVATGLVIAFSGVTLPEPVDRFLAFVGGAAGPTALFALGLALARWAFTSDLPTVIALAVAKLVLHPLLMWLVLGPGLGIDPFWVQAGVLFAALPIATNVFVIAARYEASPEPVAAAIVLTTVVATLTFPFTAWLIGV